MSTPSTLVADRYRLVKLLGTGGMGVVWQAWDERLQRPVALKMLRTQPELTDRERDVATNRAMREARITAGLHHPHAVTVFDVVEHEGQPCIVMQLIESTPLSVLLREHGTLTPRETARIAAQVSSALAAAHKMRIVHRDVKPGNILITEDGSAMISDFGISHALGDATITATGMVHGTPAYLAPEVARGQPSSFASDVFSLGSTLYTMLEGAPPFGTDNNAIALLHKVARGDYSAPKHAGRLKPLLRSMLSADPKRRPNMNSVASRLSAMYESTDAPAASELPTVPLGDEPTVALGVDDQPGATAATREVGSTAATERLAAAAASAPVAKPVRNRPSPPPAARPLGSRPSPPPLVEPEPEPEAPQRRRTGALVGIVLLVGILVLAGGVFLFGPLRQDAGTAGGPNPSETPTTTQTPDATTPTPETQSPETQAPPVGAEPSPPPAEEEAAEPPPPSAEQRIVDALTSYYTIVPGDLDSAWPMMTADYQVNHVGGRDAYGAFWGEVADVEITDVSASPPDGAQATLTYYFNDGSVVQEVTAYRLVDEGGVLKIAATEVLSSVEL
jgi:serine/threonine protein kinase